MEEAGKLDKAPPRSTLLTARSVSGRMRTYCAVISVLSQEIFDFCGLVDSWFPPLAGVERKLLATFSRAICSGVAQSFNVAVRRLQLSVSAQIPVPLVSAAAQAAESEASCCRPLTRPRNPRSASSQSSLFSTASVDSLLYGKLAAIVATPPHGGSDGRDGTGRALVA